jgi:HEAT repeat protein
VTAARSPATESGREALAVLARAGRVDAAERLRELAESEASAERRLDLLVSLATVGDARAVPALKAQLGSPQPRSRQRAAAALGSLGPAAAPAVSDLVPLLDDADRQVALTAAAALVAILPPARQPNGAG